MIGLFPAAGRATRLGLPSGQSKEVLEIAPGRYAGDCLLQAYATADVDAAVVLHREEKTDIATHYNAHPIAALPIRYHVIEPTPSTLHTLCVALDYLPHEDVALGFPDIQFNAPDAFAALRNTLNTSTADIVLGLFDTDKPHKVDMVDSAPDGTVREIVIKPPQTDLTRSWILAVWRPRFSQWLRENLASLEAQHAGELYVGNAFQAVMELGWEVRSHYFEGAKLLDIGTHDDLERAETFFNNS